MIHHVWTVLCSNASFDAQTNSISLLNLIGSVNFFGNLSSEHPGLFSGELVSSWYREQNDTPINGYMRAYYTDPDKKDAEPIELEIPNNPTPFHHTRITMSAFPVPEPGLYNFHIELRLDGESKWKNVANIPLMVTTQPLPPEIPE